jgi:hypothetical protein
VITPTRAAGDRAALITAQPIGNPPFAPLGLRGSPQIARVNLIGHGATMHNQGFELDDMMARAGDFRNTEAALFASGLFIMALCCQPSLRYPSVPRSGCYPPSAVTAVPRETTAQGALR